LMRCVVSVLSVASWLAGVGDTGLGDAAKRTDRAAIRALLQKHVEVNAPQIDGTTALDWAANNDDLETAELLVRAGANVKAANRYGMTPLSLACTNGNGAMVALFLKAGADPNSTLPGAETALMTAARTGKVEAVEAPPPRGARAEGQQRQPGATHPVVVGAPTDK